MPDNISSPSEAELRKIFADVIVKALADSQKDDIMAGPDLEEAIPNISKLIKRPEFSEFKAVFFLLVRWAHAKSHDGARLYWEPKIRVDEARELIEEVLVNYRNNSPISNPQILEFSKGPKGCLFGLLNF